MEPAKPEKLPIRHIEWNKLVPFIAKANRALAYYDGILFGIPNPEILLSPLTTQEAVLSARIEGTQTTLSEVLKFEAGEKPKEQNRQADIQEILNYREALHIAEDELQQKPFSLNLLKKLHAKLLGGTFDESKMPGQFRDDQNWIGVRGRPIEEAQFIPPDPSFILELLENWVEYYHSSDMDLLTQLAVLHAQFETIHPFTDGNGRIGRLVIPVFLFEKKMLSRPVFYLSEYFETNRRNYIYKLRAIGSVPNAWNNWIEFFLAAIAEQAQANSKKAQKIHELYDRLKQDFIKITHSKYAISLLDNIFKQPVFQSSILFNRTDLPSKQMIMRMIAALKRAGILKQISKPIGPKAEILALAELVNLSEGKTVI